MESELYEENGEQGRQAESDSMPMGIMTGTDSLEGEFVPDIFTELNFD